MTIRSTLNILIAEDNPVNQKVAQLMLQRLGHRTDLAANGQEVLRALENQSCDLVLMDIQMPKMDGIEATKHIRSRWQQGPKIIAITSFDPEFCREQCFSAGVDDFINKPIRMNELDAAIDRNMSLSSSKSGPLLFQPI
ncbi:response regulator [Methanothrix soehngenii]|jgi:CheY-like chemotaxis protein|uniref:Response regulator receiver domain protein n=1 Tax=Methanothrix soehngenii (strain ATCC 5969 / DSM 3671 / JCM 10134 / NBRC 103675 / OCM 69 / GP-6) TaxID=990316 RepID=F4BWG1_METSG|nr:response regulator [Methanothrix soehngenii]AEB67278.1 response regulator receiver domain protein [Methanothrix soehngenii GP6]MDD3551473.1 response regulator [Methanothrix soehngenii]MDY0412341.1 response regulator [Methanothrix soehngenii]HNQ51826.1 response regulator [Methanothrix soehngenii]HNT45323.1 response regulator [Methanothrix soehngenii]